MNDEQGGTLVRWARARLRQELGGPRATPPAGAWTEEPGATFVTLRWRDGGLQGCVGSLEPRRAIVADVAHNAIGAALFDPRSDPVVLADVEELHVELSVLSALEPIACEDEAGAAEAMRVGVDGIVLGCRGRRATFLPAMWPTFPEPRAFLHALRQKAGLDPSFWSKEVAVWRYTVDKFVDPAS